jgi:hypothetical protein
MKYTLAMGISTQMSNSSYPISFADSVKRNDTLTFTLFQCNKYAPAGTCDFDPSALYSKMVEENHPMIGRVESNEVENVESSACDED